MRIPRITNGFGALTPEVWSQISRYMREQPQGARHVPKLSAFDPDVGFHKSSCGVFPAELLAASKPGDGNLTDYRYRWIYRWKPAIFLYDIDEGTPDAAEHPDITLNEGDDLSGTVIPSWTPTPEGGFISSGSFISDDDHLVYDITGQTTGEYPWAFNLAEWGNGRDSGIVANGLTEDELQGMEPKPIFDSEITYSNNGGPVVMMFWTKYMRVRRDTSGTYPSGAKNHVCFFFDRQNPIGGECEE